MIRKTDEPLLLRSNPPGGRSPRYRIFAGLGVFLLVVVVTEILLRLYVNVMAAQTTPTAEAAAIIPLPHSMRGYTLRPGLGPPFSTNGHGFRGEPVNAEKPAGVRRIVMLGDSITFGNSVAWNQTFSYELQRMLNERAGRRKFEVLNLGVSGYNTGQELATLRELGLAFSPDLIILNVCLNDSDPVKTASAIGLINDAGIRKPRDINLRTIVEASYLLTMLKHSLVTAFENHPEILRMLNSPEILLDARTHETRWSEMKGQMQAIFAIAREYQISIAMVIYPYSSQVGLPPARLEPQQDLLEFAAANGVPVLEASPVYVNQPEDMFVDGFIHLSPHGHRVIAAAMLDFLTARGLLPADRAATGRRRDVVPPTPVAQAAWPLPRARTASRHEPARG